MNKLKNIGISALAGTLVSLSAAQAGGVSVTGNWELSYTNLNHTKVSGNKFGINKNITFGSGGDVSDGGGVTWGTTVAMSDTVGLSSASMNLNMGGVATLAYDSGTGGYGANAVDNVVPTAWEEIDYGLSTGITDVGAVSSTKGVVNLTVKAPGAGSAFSISYASRMGTGHVADGASVGEGGNTKDRGLDVVIDVVNYQSAGFDARWGVAMEYELPGDTCKGMKNETDSQGQKLHSCNGGIKDNPYGGSMYFTTKFGPLSLGTQATFKDPMESAATGIKNKRSIIAGAALTLGDTFSISYGEAWDRYRYNDRNRVSASGLGTEYMKIKYRGWSTAMNFGPVALKATRNNVGGWGEAAASSGHGLDLAHTEVNLSIAF